MNGGRNRAARRRKPVASLAAAGAPGRPRAVSAGQRTLRLKGSAGQLSQAFGVELRHYKAAAGSYRVRTGSILSPQELEEIGGGVHGLDGRPVAKRHSRLRGPAWARLAGASERPTCRQGTWSAAVSNFRCGIGKGGRTCPTPFG
jgi:subtilase family serine protease